MREFLRPFGRERRKGNYHCTDCGQKYSVTDAVAEQDGYGLSLYALEYYCGTCDDQGKNVPQ